MNLAGVRQSVRRRFFFRPSGACPSLTWDPTAYAVGCILSPPRGLEQILFTTRPDEIEPMTQTVRHD